MVEVKSATGKVYSVRKGDFFYINKGGIQQIKVRKTGGRAETQMKIYFDGRLLRNKKVEWDAGNFTDEGRYTTVDLTGISTGRMLRIEFTNQSVGKTFSYKLKLLKEKTTLIKSDKDNISGTLLGKQKKTIYTNKPCGSRSFIDIWKYRGKARASVKVFEKRSDGTWRPLNQYSKTIEKNESDTEFYVNSSRELKIELRNLSVGNRFKYNVAVKPKK